MPTLSRIACAVVLIVSAECNNERLVKLEQQNQELQAQIKRSIRETLLWTMIWMRKCSREARTWFNENWGRTDKNTVLLNYSNHYNKAQNKCFILVEYHYKLVYPTWVGDDLLWDVHENVKYGDLSVTHEVRFKPEYHVEKVFGSCEVYGTKCKTVDEFNDLVRPYLNE